VGALVNDGQISLAQTINFKILNSNDANQNAYIQQIDLSKKRTDMVDAKIATLFRKPLPQTYLKLKNRSYIGKSWYIMQGCKIYTNRTTDRKLLLNPPSATYKVELGAKKELHKRGFMQMQIEYNHNMRNYFSFWFDGEYRGSTDLTYGTKIGKNIQANESTQLYLGGKKDLLAPRLQYQILPSTAIILRYEKSKFYSQDNRYLGEGSYFKTTLSHKIRNGYPDILVALFYDNGIYKETSGSRGVIDKLQKKIYAVLPNKFYDIGLNLSYGMANRSIYTRVWRPYFTFSPLYNSVIDNYTYSFEAGYGGKVWHQDHLSIGASYSDSVNGISGKIIEIYLNYQFLYTSTKEF